MCCGAALLLVMLAGGPARGQPAEPDKNAIRHAEVALISRELGARPGEPLRLGLLFKMKPGWHIYWNGFTTSGIPPTVDWNLPSGVTADDLEFPAPTRHVEPGEILDHIYEGRVLLPVTVHVPATAKPGENLSIKGRVGYLVCSDVCVGENADVTLSIPIKEARDQAELAPANRSIFQEFEAQLPRPLSPDDSTTAAWNGGAVTIASKGASRLQFFPSHDSVDAVDLIKDGDAHGEQLTIRIAPDAPKNGVFEGVLTVTRGSDKASRSFVIRLTHDQPMNPGPNASKSGQAIVPAPKP